MKEGNKKDLVSYRFERAKETLLEVDVLINNKLWNTAINRLYYACYYAATALLLEKEVQTTTHAGVRQMLGLHFIKSGIIERDLGKIFSDLFDKRQSGDYEDFIDYTEEDTNDLLPGAKKFIERVGKILEK